MIMELCLIIIKRCSTGTNVTGAHKEETVHGNTTSRRGRQELVKETCGFPLPTRGTKTPGKPPVSHRKREEQTHLWAKTRERKTSVQDTNTVPLPVFGPPEKEAAHRPVIISGTRQVQKKVSLSRYKEKAYRKQPATRMKERSHQPATRMKKRSPHQPAPRMKKRSPHQPAPRMKERSPHQPATRLVMGKVVQVSGDRQTRKRAWGSPVDMRVAKLKNRNTLHQVSRHLSPTVVHETPVDKSLRPVLKRLYADVPGSSRTKKVTFGEKVRVIRVNSDVPVLKAGTACIGLKATSAPVSVEILPTEDIHPRHAPPSPVARPSGAVDTAHPRLNEVGSSEDKSISSEGSVKD